MAVIKYPPGQKPSDPVTDSVDRRIAAGSLAPIGQQTKEETIDFGDPAEIAAAIAASLQIPGLGSLFPRPAGGGGDSSAVRVKEMDIAEERRKQAAEDKRKAYGAAASSQMLQDQLAALPTRFQGLAGLLDQSKATNEQYIQDQYRNALADLTSRRDTGAELQRQGFETSREALTRMAPTAYQAPALQLPQAATNQLSQYLSARGLPQQEIEAEVVKVNQASQDAQTNYTGLLGTLSAIEQNAQQSRLVENNLAQALANAQLQTIYGGATSGLEQERLKGLNDLYNQLQQQKFQLEQTKIAREDALNDALATLAQAGYPIRGADEATQPPGGGGGGGGGGGPLPGQLAQTATPQEIITNQLANLAPAAQAQSSTPQELLAALSARRATPFAKGGVVTKPTLAIVGEDGPEAIVPLSKPKDAKRVSREAKKEMVRQKFLNIYGARK
jgi:hypothetical protein